MTQEAVIAALSTPGFYPHAVDRVEHLQTHISHVFLAGAHAYKLKKAVTFPFLDFGTVDLRRHYCEEELRLNRRLCPEIYVDVLPIHRRGDGALGLAGGGDPVDYLVHMRRLPAADMLDTRVRAGRVSLAMMDQLAATIAEFHARAPSGPAISAHAAPAALLARWEENLVAMGAPAGTMFAPEDQEILAEFGAEFIADNRALLGKRGRSGRVREGHGDLHASNICIVDPAEGPAARDAVAPGVHIFDCIEFSDAFRCNDVASEIAFLAMDLESLGRPDLSARVVTAYVARAGDLDVHRLLSFYAADRACVRAKVDGLKSAEAEVDAADRAAAASAARAHFELAVRYAWRAHGPMLIAVAGLSGTGKSALATALAAATGFEYVSSDVLRGGAAASLAPGPGAQSYGAGRYSPAARQAVYGRIAEHAATVLAAGRGVVVDATFIHRADRERVAVAACGHGAPVVFVDCQAAPTVVRERLRARNRIPHISDARWDTYEAQRCEREPFAAGEEVVEVDTSGHLATARATALRALWRRRVAIYGPGCEEPRAGRSRHPTGDGTAHSVGDPARSHGE